MMICNDDETDDTSHSFVVFGATGFLACRVVLPHLFELHRQQQLPLQTRFYGFTSKKINKAYYRSKVSQYFVGNSEAAEERKLATFWSLFSLIQGDYDTPEDYERLAEKIAEKELKLNVSKLNRIFYLALPPIAFNAVTLNISRKCMSFTGWNRVVIEKPFARDSVTYMDYQTQLCQTFMEKQIYLINHNLGKDIVQKFLVWRFSNTIFSNTWNNQSVECVMITHKETAQLGRRAAYFDSHGVIRDLVQNHMMLLLSTIAMEQPCSTDTEDIRNERLKVLRSIITVDLSDVVLGQYVNSMRDTDPCKVGYTEQNGIPADSLTATYVLIVVHVETQRWKGVPFILRCGKAMDVCKTEVRVQYKNVDPYIFGGETPKNELVISIRPKEEIYLRHNTKPPDEHPFFIESSKKRLSDKRFKYLESQNTFRCLLLDVFVGCQLMFLRSDEICETWRILSPVLQKIEMEKIKPHYYPLGSRGPRMAYNKAEAVGFKFYSQERPPM